MTETLKTRDDFQGSVSISQGRAMVTFSFHPRRIEAIKKIPRARYHKEEKAWSIPLESLELLKKTPYFRPDQIEYPGAEGGVVQDSPERQGALAELQSNPFEVPPEILKAAAPDITISTSERGGYPLLTLAVVSPRRRKAALDIVSAAAGTHWLRGESGYFIAASELPALLKKLRDGGFSFGVEATLGRRLKESAPYRNAILKGEHPPEAHDLKRALLKPFIADGALEDGTVCYSLQGFTTEQLKLLFPKQRDFKERKLRAMNLSRDELLQVVFLAKRAGIRLFFTAQAEWELKMLRKELEREIDDGRILLDESVIAETTVQLCWVRVVDGGAGIVTDREWYLKNLAGEKANPLAAMTPELRTEFPGKLFFRIPEITLLERYKKFQQQLPTLVQTDSFGTLLEQVRERTKKRERIEALKAQGDATPGVLPELPILSQLFPHQRIAVQFIRENEAAFLGDDMGLGKTLSVLASFETMLQADEAEFLLVLCPNSLTRNWIREGERWLPHRRFLLLGNEKKEKIETLKKLEWGALQPSGLIINYEGVRLEYVLEKLKAFVASKRTLLCCDESQRAKNHQSKTFEALVQLAPLCKRRILLSGTPTPRDLSDLWAQLRLLDGGERLGTNFYRWLESVAVLGNSFSDFAVQSYRPEGVQETVLRLQEILLRRKKEEVVNLPEKTFSTRDVALGGDQQKRYDEIRKELILRISAASGQTFTREISSILEEYLRAVQIASNPRIIDENWKGEPAKFIELDEIVNEVVRERGEKIVIWTNYLVNIRELTERYKEFGARPFSGEVSTAERDRTVQEFQGGDAVKVLVAIPAAGGVGITLTAAQTAVYVDKTWNAEQYLQSIDRIHRIGQTGTVNIISLHSSKVDWLIWRNLRRKAEAQSQLLGDDAPQGAFSLTSAAEEESKPTREELLGALRND